MRIERITIRIDERQAGVAVHGNGGVLTCFLKDNTRGKPLARRKAVVICPGGGYEFCSTREAEPVAMQFLAMDCQAFTLNYSVAPNPFPVALFELASAVALIREQADEWHVDRDRIVVCGFSAGGHLAASLGVFWNRESIFRGLGISADLIRPDGLILSYPVISFGEYGHEGSFSRLFTGANGIGRELLSLECQVSKAVPPVFLWHTDRDQTVPVENSLLLAMALKKAGVSLEMHIFPEGRHGLALANEETGKDEEDGRGAYVVEGCQIWIGLVKAWLDLKFRP